MIIYPAHLSERRQPANLKPGDEFYFNNANQLLIPDTCAFELRRSSILKDHIFHPADLRFYTGYSHILPNSFFKQFKKIYQYLLPFQKLKKGAWVIDEWSHEYFHWITDALTRMLVLEERNGNIPVILPGRFQDIPYIVQSLEFLGWDAHFYNPNRRLAVDQLLMVSHTAPTGNYNKQIIQKLRQRFIKKNPAESGRKIYISRRKAARRKITNEQEIIPLLRDRGFEIICFEDFSFWDQVDMLNIANCLIGAHGAGLTNMLFISSPANILEFRHEEDVHNNCFFTLASDLDHHYYYLRCSSTHNDPYLGDLTVNPLKLVEIIDGW